MKIGKLTHQMQLQTETPTSDGAGGYTHTWTTLATLWANIKPITGREMLSADRLEGRVTHKIVLRWRSDLTPTPAMRLTLGTRIFNIHAVLNENEANRFWIVLAEEGTAA